MKRHPVRERNIYKKNGVWLVRRQFHGVWIDRRFKDHDEAVAYRDALAVRIAHAKAAHDIQRVLVRISSARRSAAGDLQSDPAPVVSAADVDVGG